MERQPGATEGPHPAQKRCPDCGEVKPLDAFCRNKNRRNGHAAYCRSCHKARNKESVQRLYGSHRHYRLLNKYGIGAAEVAALVDQQGGLCAVCRCKPAIQVDHDHASGQVRGVLCDGCNGVLSAFRESEELLLRAIAYLERWN